MRIKDTLFRASYIVPYPLGTAVFEWLFRRRWARRILFERRVRIVKRLLPLAAVPHDENDVIERSLAANVLRGWRIVALARCSARRFDEWVTISGLPLLEGAFEKGKGVIVINSHFGLERCVTLVLNRLGYDVHSIEIRNQLASRGIEEAKEVTIIEIRHEKALLRAVYKARRAVENGAALHIVADGYLGSSGITLPFHGRARRFSSSFAGLAVSTRANVVPVFTSIDVAGRVNLEFLEPLDFGPAELARDGRIENLIKQYIALLEARWAEDPGGVSWIEIRLFRRLPRAEPLLEGDAHAG